VPEPIAVNQLAAAFERLRSEGEETPAGRAAWAAFVALAEHPAQAGGAAAGISEDMLMFDVSAEEGEQPNIRLVRIVGLEDADSDYVGSRTLECVLVYDQAHTALESRAERSRLGFIRISAARILRRLSPRPARPARSACSSNSASRPR
jgi:hypothetical protein